MQPKVWAFHQFFEHRLQRGHQHYSFCPGGPIDTENDSPVRNEQGFMKKVDRGETGLLIMEISEKPPLPGYSDNKKDGGKNIP